MLNTQTLMQLLTDPHLREQIGRLLRRKIQADASTLEANAYMSRQLLALVRKTKSGTEAARALRNVIKEYLDFCETLVNLQFNFNNTLMEKLRTISDSDMATPSPATVAIVLAAPRNTTARVSFRIENTRRSPISVAFETTPFVSEDGTQLIPPDIAFDPPSLKLQPEQEAKIELILQVGEQFKPDITYLATVTVRGLDAPNLLIRLHVEADRKEAESPQAPADLNAPDEAAQISPDPAKTKTAAARRISSSKTKRKTR